MASFAKNIRTLFVNRKVRSAYIKWQSARLFRRSPVIELPAGAVAGATQKFNDFYAIFNQHPSEAELRTYQ
jgi:hypothetical protein